MRKPFTPEQDKRICEAYADYEVSMVDLSARFGGTNQAISHAIKRHLNLLLKRSPTWREQLGDENRRKKLFTTSQEQKP